MVKNNDKKVEQFEKTLFKAADKLRKNPTIDTLTKIAEALGVNVDELIRH